MQSGYRFYTFLCLRLMINTGIDVRHRNAMDLKLNEPTALNMVYASLIISMGAFLCQHRSISFLNFFANLYRYLGSLCNAMYTDVVLSLLSDGTLAHTFTNSIVICSKASYIEPVFQTKPGNVGAFRKAMSRTRRRLI